MTSDPVTLMVLGRAAPQGSKRHMGHGVLVESSAKVKPWREAIKAAVAQYREAAGDPELRFERGAPLAVTVTFAFDRPKSAPKRRRVWPVTRSSGDLDKLLRSTFDGLADSGLIWDDAQIVSVKAIKDYTGQLPGAVITIQDLEAALEATA